MPASELLQRWPPRDQLRPLVLPEKGVAPLGQIDPTPIDASDMRSELREHSKHPVRAAA